MDSIESLMFSGEDPEVWLSKVEEAFDEYDIPIVKEVSFASQFLTGIAYQWFKQNFYKICQMDWCAFSYHLLWEFSKRKTNDVTDAPEEKGSEFVADESESSIQDNQIDSTIVSGESDSLKEKAIKANEINSVEKEVVSTMYVQGSILGFPFHAQHLFDQMLQTKLCFLSMKVRFNEDLTRDWVRVEVGNELVDTMYEFGRVTNGLMSPYKVIVCSQYSQWNYLYQLFDEMLQKNDIVPFKKASLEWKNFTEYKFRYHTNFHYFTIIHIHALHFIFKVSLDIALLKYGLRGHVHKLFDRMLHIVVAIHRSEVFILVSETILAWFYMCTWVFPRTYKVLHCSSYCQGYNFGCISSTTPLASRYFGQITEWWLCVPVVLAVLSAGLVRLIFLQAMEYYWVAHLPWLGCIVCPCCVGAGSSSGADVLLQQKFRAKVCISFTIGTKLHFVLVPMFRLLLYACVHGQQQCYASLLMVGWSGHLSTHGDGNLISFDKEKVVAYPSDFLHQVRKCWLFSEYSILAEFLMLTNNGPYLREKYSIPWSWCIILLVHPTTALREPTATDIAYADGLDKTGLNVCEKNDLSCPLGRVREGISLLKLQLRRSNGCCQSSSMARKFSKCAAQMQWYLWCRCSRCYLVWGISGSWYAIRKFLAVLRDLLRAGYLMHIQKFVTPTSHVAAHFISVLAWFHSSCSSTSETSLPLCCEVAMGRECHRCKLWNWKAALLLHFCAYWYCIVWSSFDNFASSKDVQLVITLRKVQALTNKMEQYHGKGTLLDGLMPNSGRYFKSPNGVELWPTMGMSSPALIDSSFVLLVLSVFSSNYGSAQRCGSLVQGSNIYIMLNNFHARPGSLAVVHLCWHIPAVVSMWFLGLQRFMSSTMLDSKQIHWDVAELHTSSCIFLGQLVPTFTPCHIVMIAPHFPTASWSKYKLVVELYAWYCDRGSLMVHEMTTFISLIPDSHWWSRLSTQVVVDGYISGSNALYGTKKWYSIWKNQTVLLHLLKSAYFAHLEMYLFLVHLAFLFYTIVSPPTTSKYCCILGFAGRPSSEIQQWNASFSRSVLEQCLSYSVTMHNSSSSLQCILCYDPRGVRTYNFLDRVQMDIIQPWARLIDHENYHEYSFARVMLSPRFHYKHLTDVRTAVLVYSEEMNVVFRFAIDAAMGVAEPYLTDPGIVPFTLTKYEEDRGGTIFRKVLYCGLELWSILRGRRHEQYPDYLQSLVLWTRVVEHSEE